MFEDFFTKYSMIEPPEIYKDNPELINIELSATGIDIPTINNFVEYSGISSPFEELFIPRIKERKEIKRNKNVVDIARLFLDRPYVWGSTDPDKGFDCSGLILYAYKLIGINLPRTSHAMGKFGTEVSLSEVLPGDIIYTSSSGPSGGHVKMVSDISNGLIYVIEAKGKKLGIVESPLTNTSNIKSIRRVLNNNQKPTQRFTSPTDFVNTLNTAYKQALLNKGLNPDFSTILVALDAIETDWGKSVKGNFNYGNITAGKGEAWHNLTGKRKWRDFNSIEDYVNKKIEFLSRNRYRFFDTFTPSSRVSVAMQTLANRGYDPGNPNYGRLVEKVHNNVLKELS